MEKFSKIDINEQICVVVNKRTGAWLSTGKEIASEIEKILSCRYKSKVIGSLNHELIKQTEATGLLKKNHSKKPKCSPCLAVIHIGHKCNLSCSYCYVQKDAKYMSKKNALETAHFLSPLPAGLLIQFMGGEPLLYIQEMLFLVEALRSARNGRSTNFGIQTNGLLLLNEGIYNFLKKEKIYFGISFDGPNGMSSPRHRQNIFSYERQMEDVITKLGSQGQKFGMITVITKFNVLRLIELLDWCLKRGISRIQFSPMTKVEKKDDVLVQELGKALKQLFRYWIDNKLYKLIEIDNFVAIEDNLTTRQRNFMCRKYPCGAGIDQLAIDINGDIFPCDYLTGIKRFKLGNVRIDSVRDINSSALLAKIHDDTAPTRLVKCGECAWLSICGHCLSSAYFSGSSISGMRSTCEADAMIIKMILTELLQNKEYSDHVVAR